MIAIQLGRKARLALVVAAVEDAREAYQVTASSGSERSRAAALRVVESFEQLERVLREMESAPRARLASLEAHAVVIGQVIDRAICDLNKTVEVH